MEFLPREKFDIQTTGTVRQVCEQLCAVTDTGATGRVNGADIHWFVGNVNPGGISIRPNIIPRRATDPHIYGVFSPNPQGTCVSFSITLRDDSERMIRFFAGMLALSWVFALFCVIFMQIFGILISNGLVSLVFLVIYRTICKSFRKKALEVRHRIEKILE